MGSNRKIDEYTNKIMQGDCLQILDEIPNNSVDLLVTSPPYNIGIQYDTKFNVNEEYGRFTDFMEWKQYFDWTNEWLKKVYNIMKDDGRICIDHYLSLGGGKRKKKRVAPLMRINNMALNIGFNHHSVAIWEDITRSTFTAWGSWKSASAPYMSAPYEGILILYKKYWKKQNKGKSTINKKEFMDAVSGVWKFGTDRKRKTPATFPEKLPETCIKLLSYENDIILDPFMGSGTTAYVAKKLNRKYIGIELSKDYCNIARKRINNINI